MKIGLVSLTQAWENKTENENICLFYAKQAAELGCELLIFPEMTLTGFSMNVEKIAENPLDSPSLFFFTNLSRRFNLNIVFGIVFKEVNNLGSNNLILVSSSGELLIKYKKIHPFSFAQEELHYISGNDIGLVNLENSKFGVSICYDLRFPELYQSLSKEAIVIINIANWPAKRVHHWNALLKARAIENQIFMIGVNRKGNDGKGIEYISSSAIYNPDGEPLVPILQINDLDVYDMNVEEVKHIRESFPIKKDRKIQLYKQIL